MALLMHTLVLQRIRTELPRCRRLADEIEALGSAGAFAGALLRASIRRAECASAGDDVDAMSRSLAELELFDGGRPAPTPFAGQPAARPGAEGVDAAKRSFGPRPTWAH